MHGVFVQCALCMMSFMQRFLQHVLPKGFQKVRYFGFLHSAAKATFTALKQTLEDRILNPKDWSAPQEALSSGQDDGKRHTPQHPGRCPHCGKPLRYLERGLRCRLALGQLTLPRAPPGGADGRTL